MNVLLCIAAAAASYLLGGINPAIILSQRLYHTDIRGFGSKNPGFTNFLRSFGDKAWLVFALDIAKGLLLAGLTGLLFRRLFGLFHTGAAYSCLFAMLGHSYPVWYGFRGGKGVAVFGGAIWFIDWRAAIVAFSILGIMLLVKHYMSLGVMCAAVSVPIMLAILGPEHYSMVVMTALCALFVILRHRENIRRLMDGTESEFRFRRK